MNDAIFITGLLIHARHGVMDHEEKVGQRFAIDLELTLDLAPAGRSDKLADTVSYASIVEVATRAFITRNYRLVEAAAGDVLRDPVQVTLVDEALGVAAKPVKEEHAAGRRHDHDDPGQVRGADPGAARKL